MWVLQLPKGDANCGRDGREGDGFDYGAYEATETWSLSAQASVRDLQFQKCPSDLSFRFVLQMLRRDGIRGDSVGMVVLFNYMACFRALQLPELLKLGIAGGFSWALISLNSDILTNMRCFCSEIGYVQDSDGASDAMASASHSCDGGDGGVLRPEGV